MGKSINGKELGKGITQRKDGRYCGRYCDRFGKRKTLYDTDLRRLKKTLADAIYEDKHQINLVDDRTTVSDWYEKWFNTYKVGFIRESSLLIYSTMFCSHIKKYIGNIPLKNISNVHCTNLLKELKEDGLSWSSINKVKIICIDMFDRAIENQFLVRNPMRGVRLPINKPSNERRVLTLEEQAIFTECCMGTFYDNLFIVALNTGLRIGELAALTWEDIDLERRIISVNKTLVYQEYLGETGKSFHLEQPKTNTSIREIPINEICMIALKKQYMQKHAIKSRNIKQSDFSDRLFTTKFNTPLNSQIVLDAINSIIEQINLKRDVLDQFEPFSCHTFRHTFATRCIESGISPKVVQSYLGHATLQMTMDLYVHVTEDSKMLEINKLEQINSQIVVTDENIDDQFNTLEQKTSNNNEKIVKFNINPKMA